MTPKFNHKFTVHRPTWRRGHSESALLLNGERCCLGFLGKTLGLSDAVMEGAFAITHTESCHGRGTYPRPGVDSRLRERLEEVEDDIICLNDSGCVTDERREAELTKLFEDAGIKVVFTDDPEPLSDPKD